MKKKALFLTLAFGLTFAITGCSNNTVSTTDSSNDEKAIVEEVELNLDTKDNNNEINKHDSDENIHEDTHEDSHSIDTVNDSSDKIIDEKDNSNKADEDNITEESAEITDELTEISDESTDEPTDEPKQNVFVTNVHDVTIPSNIPYNAAVYMVTKDCTTYNYRYHDDKGHQFSIYPFFYEANLSVPGTYPGVWVCDPDPNINPSYIEIEGMDYSIVPNTNFTVTVVDNYTGPEIVYADEIEWSLSNHTESYLDWATHHAYYYGTTACGPLNYVEPTTPGDYNLIWQTANGTSYTQLIHVKE